MLRLQRTIKNEIQFEGIGLHSGRSARIQLAPASVDSGVVFIRTDMNRAEIEAIASNTAAIGYATTLSRNGVSVQTVEHLLAALAGLGIDNVSVEIDAQEVPIMDGSAALFVRRIADAGIKTQKRPRPMIKVVKPIIVRDGNKQLAIWPSEAPSVSYFIDFNHPLLKEQSLHYQVSEENFLREVSDARTFGFLGDEDALRAKGLAKGASLDNVVVLGDDAVLNKEGLRYKDEFVRHKILDLVGDLSLLGMPIIGHIVAHKSGHGLNAQMVAKLLHNPQNWIVVNAAEEAEVIPRQPEVQYQHAAL
jgi:UDP-3-O-[3-hydroxymyristoyl] N-acetylglucosamine deacetylase